MCLTNKQRTKRAHLYKEVLYTVASFRQLYSGDYLYCSINNQAHSSIGSLFEVRVFSEENRYTRLRLRNTFHKDLFRRLIIYSTEGGAEQDRTRAIRL